MTETIGMRPDELDWLIFPDLPIVGEFNAVLNGAPWQFPDGSAAWLVVEEPNGAKRRYDGDINGSRLTVRIPLEDSQVIPHLSRFRLYFQRDPGSTPVFWKSGLGVRDEW